MQALILDKYITSFDELALRSIDIPTPGPGQAVVRIFAAAINPVDYKVALGNGRSFGWELPFPYLAGSDLAGVVHAVGEGVSHVSQGDPVFATNWGDQVPRNPDESAIAGVSGAFAEYTLIAADKLVRKPPELTYEQAASLGIAATTAYQALFDYGQLQSGQRVLILGGSSAVAHFAIQFAHCRGAQIFTTCFREKKSFVESLIIEGDGVRIIDIDEQSWDTALANANVDLVINCTAESDAMDRAVNQDVVKQGGRFIELANPDAGRDPTSRQPRLSFAALILMTQSVQVQSQIAQWVVEGRVRIAIDERFPFSTDGIRALYNKVASGTSSGKNILTVTEQYSAK